MARVETNIVRDYQMGTKTQLIEYPKFKHAFEVAKKQVQKMKFRYVEVSDSNTQSLLEFYAAITLETRHNSFENH